MELTPLTVLDKKYTVRRTLEDSSPFDYKYLGERFNSSEEVIIREFFPAPLVRRRAGKTSIELTGSDQQEAFEQGLDYFEKESTVLSQLQHRALPKGYDVFEANGTLYRVRDQHPSMSLAEGLSAKGTLPEKAALTIMVPVLEALHIAHQKGLYHGSISPETIRLLPDGQVLVTGFRGAYLQLARDLDTLDAFIQPGTSAIEQYTPRAAQSPATDVYAAAATICMMVTGTTPPEATERLSEDTADPMELLVQDADAFTSPEVRDVLLEALRVDPSKRIQSANALRETLVRASKRYDDSDEAYVVVPVEDDRGPAEATVISEESTESTGGSKTPLLISAVAAMLMAGLAAWLVFGGEEADACTGFASVSINDARTCYATYQDERPVEVTVEGIITRAHSDYVRLQDESGPLGASGIVVRRTAGPFHDAINSGELAAGTAVQVSGTLSDFNGLLQINEQNLRDYEVGDTHALPSPLEVDLATIADDGLAYESVLVRLSTLQLRADGPTFEQQSNYVVAQDDRTATFRVQRPSETELPGMAIPEGTFNYEGVVGQFQGEPQLLPVLRDDLILDADGE
ncbi:MAG: hypothetical protein PPP56_10205 [Longimonas sp.]|uniref:serine/threonine protein kinase n=1 Tax=Longimonas sp. TaxID=2039626 RepID=UPI0033507C48